MSNNLLLKWKSFPLIDRPKTSIILVSGLIFLSIILWRITIISWNTPLYYILGMLLVFFELTPYFVPTSYEIYEDQIVVKYPLATVKKKYSDFGCFYFDRFGIMLSPFVRPRRLDRFRGQSLRFSKDKTEKEKIVEILEQKIEKKF